VEGCYLAIQVEKKYTLDIPQQDVWEAILDPDTLAEILPNCKSLDPIGDHNFDANIEIKIGLLKANLNPNWLYSTWIRPMVISLMLMVMAVRDKCAVQVRFSFPLKMIEQNSYLLRLVVFLVSLPGLASG